MMPCNLLQLWTALLTAWTAWTVYRLDFDAAWPDAAAVLVFTGIALAIMKKGQASSMSLRRGWAVLGWSAVSFAVMYAVLLAALHAMGSRFAGGVIPGTGLMLLIVAAVLLTVAVPLYLLVLPSALPYDAYRNRRIPLLGLLLLRRQGPSVFAAAHIVLLAAWGAALADRYIPAAGRFIGLLLLLFGSLLAVQIANRPRTAGRGMWNPAVLRVYPWIALTAAALLFIAFYGVFLRIPLPFVWGLLTGAASLIAAWILVKLKLFPVLKWLLAILAIIAFAGMADMLYFLAVE